MYPQAQQQHSSKQGRLRKVATAVVLAGALALSTVAQAADRRVAIYNTSDYTMKVYASHISVNRYYHLGSLPARDGVRMDFDDGSGSCYYDLKAVLSNGVQAERRGVNVCSIISWTVANDGNVLRW